LNRSVIMRHTVASHLMSSAGQPSWLAAVSFELLDCCVFQLGCRPLDVRLSEASAIALGFIA
jgi:hypothetical protein